jgi:hypothetical protein
MPKFANAHLVLNSRDRTLTGSSGVYNNFRVTNAGQNIVQGEMKDIALSEVLFPYDIPNVQAGYNTFQLFDGPTAPIQAVLTITVPPGFYTGSELADEINALIIAAGAVEGLTPGDLPTCGYGFISNRFVFSNPVNVAYDQEWQLASPYTFVSNYVGVTQPELGKDILSIMGYLPTQTGQIGQDGSGNEVCLSDGAPLLFTQYIDICSPKLCQNQFIRDGNTTTLARRPDLICRLYIADENSAPLLLDASGQPFVAGTRPFVIHRQFQNQRVMRWTAANSIAEIDIQLYDDCGIPLTTSWTPRNFQLTFHVYEAEDGAANANVGYRY